MSRVVEQRVTEMQFDNRNFEANVAQSINTINKLKSSMDLKSVSGSVSAVVNSGVSAANSMGVFGRAINSCSNQFSALQVMGVTALMNITNQAVNAGKIIISALTIDPIKTGFQEYETQINATQTILANTQSKGKTIKDVNKALAELNKYADMTIYNFTEMTRNIGTFTAAGVDLETSVSAIKGIANLAAISGSTSQQASTAMYQLSQALASGTVKLQDWNSVVNAGMGGQVFQDALKETARVHGVKIDAMIKKEGSFRESLKTGWLTSKVLTETLAKFTGDLNEEQLKSQGYTKKQIEEIMKLGKTANDAATKVKTFTQLFDTLKEAAQSGWTQTWQILVGDFEEAKMLLTKISDVVGGFINQMSDARNNLLQGWKDGGGRTKALEGIANILKFIGNIIKPIGEAFRNIFPPTTSDQLLSITDGFLEFTKTLVVSDDLANNIRSAFEGVFTVFRQINSVVFGVVKGLSPLIGLLRPIGELTFKVAGSLGEFTKALDDAIFNTGAFDFVFGGLTKTVDFFVNFLTNAADTIKWIFESIQNVADGKIEGMSADIVNAIEPFDKIGKVFVRTFYAIGGALQAAGNWIADAFGYLMEKVNNAISSDGFVNLFNFGNGILTSGLIIAIKKFIDMLHSFGDDIKDIGILKNVSGVLGEVKNTLKAYQSELKAKSLIEIAKALLILSAGLFVLAMIDPKALTSSLAGMGALMAELSLMLVSMEKFLDPKKSKTIIGISTSLVLLATAMSIFTLAVNKMSKIPFTSLVKGLIAFKIVMNQMVRTTTDIYGADKQIGRAARAMIPFAAALYLMTFAVEKLGNIEIVQLTKGLIGLKVVIMTLTKFLNATDFNGLGMLKGAGLIFLAHSLGVLADVIKKIGSFSSKEIIKGVATIGMLLGELSLFLNTTKGAQNVMKTATGLVILSAGMKVFASAIQDIGNLSVEQIGKGLLSMVSILGILSMAFRSINHKGIIKVSTAMVIMGSALLVLQKGLDNFGNMDLTTVAKGLLSVISLMGIISMSGRSMKSIGLITTATGILLMGAALTALSIPLKIMGSMSLSGIGKAMLTLVSALSVLGVAALVLTPVLPSLMLLGGALILIGAGCSAIGGGLMLVSSGLATLAGITAAGIGGAIVILKAAMQLIPEFFKNLGIGIVEFIKVIENSLVVLVPAIVNICEAVLAGLATLIPDLINTFVIIIMEILSTIEEHLPRFMEMGMNIIISFLQGIADNIDDVIESATNLITNFLNGLAMNLPRIIDAAFNLICSFIEGLVGGVEKYAPRIITAFINLFKAIISAIISYIGGAIGMLWKKGEEIAGAIKDGIKAKAKSVVDSIESVVQSCIDAVKNFFGKFKEAGAHLVDGLKNGIKSKYNEAKEAIGNFASGVANKFKSVLGIHSPSRVFKGFAGYMVDGLTTGIKQYQNRAINQTGRMGDNIAEAIKEVIDKIDIDDDDPNFKPVVAPVLDTSNLDKGVRSMNTLFKDNPMVTLDSRANNDYIGKNVDSIVRTENSKTPDTSVVDAIKDLKGEISNLKGGDNTYINGITYDDGSNVSNAVGTLVRAARIERRKD